jgi:hypothetical protein
MAGGGGGARMQVHIAIYAQGLPGLAVLVLSIWAA